MITLGLILLVIGIVTAIHLLFIVGAVVLVVGLILLALSLAGHGRRWF